ncbi:uncharacterized protein C12orf50 homolog [Pluvialis apricaria]
MAAAGNDCYVHFHSRYAQSIFIVVFTIPENCFLLQQKYSNISCFWERQPLGCMRINCAFHHSKPRYINGLFLPPSNSEYAPLPQSVQEVILPPAHCQESLRNQKNILLPVHPPLIINLNDEEDEEDDEEDDEEKENCKEFFSFIYKEIPGNLLKIFPIDVSNWVPKTAADIEEERAIKEMCYKSGKHGITHSFLNSNAANIVNSAFFFPLGIYLGEYYRIPYPHEHQSAKTVSSPQENELLPLEATGRDLQKGKYFPSARTMLSVGNGERQALFWGYLLDHKTVPKTGIHASDRKVKPCHQQNDQRKHDETASSAPYVRETGKKTYFDSSEPRRPAYVVYRTVTVTQEPKFSGPPDKYPSGSYNAPTWRKRNPHAKPLSKYKTTIQVTV